MFMVGDKIVYPMHGAGIIEKIEEKKILGQTREYYVLRVPCGDIKIMIPVDCSDEIGIRPIIPKSRLPEVFALLSAESTEMSSNWNRRYRENMEQLKTGDICKVAEVVRNLVRTDRAKKLSTGEKKMLLNAKQILISELILVGKMTYEEAEQVIETAI
ncbi:MAG: CarD family transcriptional regulator [Anaerovoracaceae bacterium]|jgi:CarD family transcriptional regulator